LTTAILSSGTARGPSQGLAAAVAVEAAVLTGASTLLVEVGEGARRRGPTLLASPGAREAEEALRSTGRRASARGHLCHLAVEGGASVEEIGAAVADSGSELAVVHLPGRLWVPALETESLATAGGCLLVSLPAERSLAALAAEGLARRRLPCRIATRAPGQLAARRALAGVRAGGWASELAAGIARRLLGLGRHSRPALESREGERGQALPALLGAGLILILAALVLAAIGGAATGKGRVQRAADLAALSAVRSMRDDTPRLLAPERLPGGEPNERHLSRAEFLGRARLAAIDAARRNEVDPSRLRVAFPDATANPPLQARATVVAQIDPDQLPGGNRLSEHRPIRVVASAVAEASAPVSSWTGMPSQAEGGGYSGPLVYRDGEGMRPDVAAAYDRMAAAARHAGLDLVVVSGFRSDAEQARLFAQHPDPRWVAPPGHSLHRCATELDLGPSSAYGWLDSHAPKFGFLRRYSWEAWHFGYNAGPPPCSEAGNAGGLGEGDGAAASFSLPSFVPAVYREPLLRSASRWNVSPGLLAAQLMAESGFNPHAVSPAGALGIAQFMPSTAQSYGLRDPFNAVAAIDAQAHLMSDLLRQFHSVPLALAAYNAGSGAVAACHCSSPYPETRVYVARILALAGGAGVLLAPPLEVRLVK
jgi:hypothetical protein